MSNMTSGMPQTITLERTLFAGPLRGYDIPLSVSADAKAEASSWASNTWKAYAFGWQHFTSRCIENR